MLYLSGIITENQYYESIDAAQEQIKSPTGATLTHYFETAQGSKYILSSKIKINYEYLEISSRRWCRIRCR